MELKDTVGMMSSSDYRDRFKAEYYQLKIRYEKLKGFFIMVQYRINTLISCGLPKVPLSKLLRVSCQSASHR